MHAIAPRQIRVSVPATPVAAHPSATTNSSSVVRIVCRCCLPRMTDQHGREFHSTSVELHDCRFSRVAPTMEGAKVDVEAALEQAANRVQSQVCKSAPVRLEAAAPD
jgi:hypothetical protein